MPMNYATWIMHAISAVCFQFSAASIGSAERLINYSQSMAVLVREIIFRVFKNFHPCFRLQQKHEKIQKLPALKVEFLLSKKLIFGSEVFPCPLVVSIRIQGNKTILKEEKKSCTLALKKMMKHI